MSEHSGGIFSRFQSQLAESEASDRSFGFLLSVFFLVVGLIPLWKRGEIRWWAVAAAAVMLLLALIAPSILRQPKRAWLFLGFMLGMVVNPIVLGFLFFVIVTPVALIMRLFGHDALRLRGDPNAPTYWQT